jgi:DNA-binding IclR family transcriptional regulator
VPVKVLDSKYIVPALERGLRMLQLFDRKSRLLTGAEMARALAIPRSAAFRLAHTLERCGFLERNGDHYRIGAAVLRLGFESIACLDLSDLGRPVVERLCEESGFPSQLVIRDGREAVVVLKSSPPTALVSNVVVGTRFPAHATILGRVLLSDADDATLAALYPERTLPRLSPRTPRTVADLKRLLLQDRARGYAISESFFEPGISAIAAPVKGADGRIVAAVSVTVQRPTLEPDTFRERLARLVVRAAGEFSHALNYREPKEVA